MMAQGQYKLPMHPQALAENMITGDTYRITVLTEGLIRLEYSEDGIFEDRATQTVLNRDFPAGSYRAEEENGELRIVTRRLRLRYDRKAFSARGLQIEMKCDSLAGGGVWHYGDSVDDLGGTVRTLDGVDGDCKLGHGLMSILGFSVLDDSRSLILTDDGWVEPRRKGICDLYFWGYGADYLECLKDFYHLCGKTPMLPRFALGNWWSRYYEYTEESYLELMERFDREGIPFSVAVIDMDWHLVKIDPKYGSGWTGYTWNREFFPDPERFMRKLHERGMRITLNVHPAEGVGAHEEMYAAMAKELGRDISREAPIAFDITDPAFLAAYFKYLHHPQEEKGVDFWWLDWQQGGVTKMEGMDPLWMLNHFHFLDSARDGKRPMTFSRYAGPGSHRYPVGFSGDTVITWESLRFQPYFTSTASNIGYGWWSHDIGGHMRGYKNDELEARWYQFGVFSPINRLHSTKNEFNGKEPWRFRAEVRAVMDDFLRLRHRLVPYLYTMNHRAWAEDTPLVLPVYYRYPKDWAAYRQKNEYFFGSELLVMPITSPAVPGINRARETVWLPEGTWIDFFTGVIYEGGRTIRMYRGIESMPVLAKAGAIVPMQGEKEYAGAQDRMPAASYDDTQENVFMASVCVGEHEKEPALTAYAAAPKKLSVHEDAPVERTLHMDQNPAALIWRIYGGADGRFVLYEDDNVSCDYQKGICAETAVELSWNEDPAIVIHPAKGELSLIPAERTHVIEFYGCRENEAVCTADGKPLEVHTSYEEERHCLRIVLPAAPVTAELTVRFTRKPELAGNDTKKLAYDFLDRAEMDFDQKTEIYRTVCSGKSVPVILSQLQVLGLSEDMLGCLTEILTAWPDRQ